MKKIGCDDPCPCDSGKKFKHCCQNQAAGVNDELFDMMSGQDFDSLDEAQGFVDGFIQQRNQQLDDDFHGLSPDQMHRLLHFAFDSPELFVFSGSIAADTQAPVLTLARYMVEAIDEKGLKLTAKGNLPQKLCKEAANDFRQDLSSDDILHYTKVNKEEDFFDLHVTRVLFEVSGLLRKSKGRLFLTKKCRQLLANGGVVGLYPLLLQNYCRKFNWSYRDGFVEYPFIQQSWLFSVYLLTLYGGDWKPFSFYESCYLQAFPALLDMVDPKPYTTAEDEVSRCYGWRTLNNFLNYFGLANLEKLASDKKWVTGGYRIIATPLLAEVGQFVFMRENNSFH